MIATRSILPFEAKALKIVTCRPRNKDRFKKLANRRNLELFHDPDRENIKRKGILCFLKYWRQVEKAMDDAKQTDRLYGRRFRLWRPLLAICKVFAPRDYNDVLDLAEKDAEKSAPSDYIYEVENAVIACTLGKPSILLKELTQSVSDYLYDQNMKWQTVRSAAENLGCVKKKRDTKDGKKFDLRRETIFRLAQTRGIIGEEGKPIELKIDDFDSDVEGELCLRCGEKATVYQGAPLCKECAEEERCRS